MGDITKLPKWAQDLIVGLRRDVEAATAAYYERSQKESRVSIYDPIHATKNPRVLVLDVTYRFHTKDGYIDVGFDNYGRLIARADHDLSVGPEAHNSAQLLAIKR